MKIKTLQWNIGGAKVRRESADPLEEASYVYDDLNYIAEIIKHYGTDVVTLQETHANELTNQVQALSTLTSLPYWRNDIHAHSHLEEGMQLGIGVLSQFPIRESEFTLFMNPHFRIAGSDGSTWISHDKGVGTYFLEIDQNVVEVKSTHLIPFRRFGVDPTDQSVDLLRDDLELKLKSNSRYLLLQGDFNYDQPSLAALLPELCDSMNEVILEHPTTPHNRWYDHVLYRGLNHLESTVLDHALTDHYPIYSEFEIY